MSSSNIQVAYLDGVFQGLYRVAYDELYSLEVHHIAALPCAREKVQRNLISYAVVGTLEGTSLELLRLPPYKGSYCYLLKKYYTGHEFARYLEQCIQYTSSIGISMSLE